MASYDRSNVPEESLTGIIFMDPAAVVADSGGDTVTAVDDFWDDADQYLETEGASSGAGAKTCTVKWRGVLPVEFPSQSDVQVKVNCRTESSITGTPTIDAQMFRHDKQGSVIKNTGTPVDLIATAAQNIDNNWTEYTFAVTSDDSNAPLIPGAHFTLMVRLYNPHSGGSPIKGNIGDVYILHDVKG